MHEDSVSRSIANVGDLNRDGFDDLVLGDPLESTCLVFLGRADGLRNLPVALSITGAEDGGDLFGWAVAGRADVDGDGHGDVLVSARNSGVCYVFLGSALALAISSGLSHRSVGQMVVGVDGFKIVGSSSSLLTGLTASFLGDVDGDGFVDVAVSSISKAGDYEVWLVFLDPSRLVDLSLDQLVSSSSSSSRVWRIVGPSYSFTGFSIAGLGDMDGDGLADFAIGSIPFTSTRPQQTFVVYGTSQLGMDNGMGNGNDSFSLQLTDLAQGRDGFVVTGAGFLVAGAGDVNGDGLADLLLVRAEGWQGRGNAFLLSLPTNLTSSPSLSPSSSPSSVPSQEPTSSPSISPASSPSSMPSTTSLSPSHASLPSSPSLSSSLPSVAHTVKPSASPRPSLRPSRLPSARPSPRPSAVPTLTPSQIPSRRPSTEPTRRTARPITARPTPPRFPSSQPSTNDPTSSASESFTVRRIEQTGVVSMGSDNEKFVVAVGQGVGMGMGMVHFESSSPSQGAKIFVILPAPRTTIILDEFREGRDVLNLAQFSALRQVGDLSFSTDPLTLQLSPSQQLVLRSHDQLDLTAASFVFSSSQLRGVGEQSVVTADEKVAVSLAVLGAGVLLAWAYASAATRRKEQEEKKEAEARRRRRSSEEEDNDSDSGREIQDNKDKPGHCDAGEEEEESIHSSSSSSSSSLGGSSASSVFLSLPSKTSPSPADSLPTQNHRQVHLDPHGLSASYSPRNAADREEEDPEDWAELSSSSSPSPPLSPHHLEDTNPFSTSGAAVGLVSLANPSPRDEDDDSLADLFELSETSSLADRQEQSNRK